MLGAAESDCGELDAALAHLEAGVAARRPDGKTPRLGDNLCAFALASLRAGNIGAASAASDEIAALHAENPALAPQPTEWLFVAARVARARGDETTCGARLRAAIAIMRARAAAIDDDETRAAFLALPFNREVVRY